MERINYSQIIQDILSNHSINDIANGTEIQLLFDTQRHHYQVLNIGWGIGLLQMQFVNKLICCLSFKCYLINIANTTLHYYI